METSNNPTISRWQPHFAADFERLNREWLEQHFSVEPVDAQILADPVRHIIDTGGDILFASLGAEVVGTCALKFNEPGVVELNKMAVTAAAQGLGIGHLLMQATLARYLEFEADILFLESHSKLAPALHLYERYGFRNATPRKPSKYCRCEVYMEWDQSQYSPGLSTIL